MARRDYWLVLWLVAVTAVVYAASFPAEFHFDDYALMLENPHVSGTGFSPLLLLQQYGGRPLTLLTFHWNYLLAGRNPTSYHVVSLILHLVAVALLYVFLLRTFGSRFGAALASLIFALHPVQTQAVNYIWSRSVLLMFCLGGVTILLARRSPWVALACFQLAIWSRTDAVIFLIPLLVLNPRRWKAPVGVALANIAAFALFLSWYQPKEIGWNHPTALAYWQGQAVALWKYAGLVFWPAGLTIDHDFAVGGGIAVWAAVGGFVLMLAGLWFLARAYLPAVGGIAWFFLSLLPAALVPSSDPFNESRIYPALAGLAFMVAYVAQRGPSRQMAAVGVLLLGSMVPVTIARNRTWTDDVKLWADAAQKSPAKSRIRYNLGTAWVRKGNLDQAERSFLTAAQLNPRDDWSRAALGYCAEVRRDWTAAVAHYQEAVMLNGENWYARDGLSRIQNRTPVAQDGKQL